MEIKEREGAQVKGIVNIVNKIIGENTPNLEKEIFMQIFMQILCTQNAKKQNSLCHTVVKNYDQERLYKPQTASDFSTEILKARRTWDIEYQALEDGNCQPRKLVHK